ncbi:hypothetical protein [Alsobacter sp. SYSU BS001988]|jgi:hypothetical protein
MLTALLLGKADANRLEPSETSATSAAPARPSAAAWVKVNRPIPMFSLETTLLPRDPRGLVARRHVEGGGREEVHSFGAVGSPGGFASIAAYRAGSEAGAPGTLFLEAARRAAETGLAVTRSSVPTPMATKFGQAETADILLTADGVEHACVAWRILGEDAQLRLAGWQCGGAGKAIDRLTLACALDRLDLVGAGDDAALKAYFSRAERNRLPQCGSKAAPGGRRAAWLDPEIDPSGLLRSQS